MTKKTKRSHFASPSDESHATQVSTWSIRGPPPSFIQCSSGRYVFLFLVWVFISRDKNMAKRACRPEKNKDLLQEMPANCPIYIEKELPGPSKSVTSSDRRAFAGEGLHHQPESEGQQENQADWHGNGRPRQTTQASDDQWAGSKSTDEDRQ